MEKIYDVVIIGDVQVDIHQLCIVREPDLAQWFLKAVCRRADGTHFSD